MDCYICGSKDEVKNVELYTHGSEATDLCLTCRITLTNLIRGMVSMAQTQKKRGFKMGRKLREVNNGSL